MGEAQPLDLPEVSINVHHLWRIPAYRFEVGDTFACWKHQYDAVIASIEKIKQHILQTACSDETDSYLAELEKHYCGGHISFEQRHAVRAAFCDDNYREELFLQAKHAEPIPRKRPGESRQSKKARARKKAGMAVQQQDSYKDTASAESVLQPRPGINVAVQRGFKNLFHYLGRCMHRLFATICRQRSSTIKSSRMYNHVRQNPTSNVVKMTKRHNYRRKALIAKENRRRRNKKLATPGGRYCSRECKCKSMQRIKVALQRTRTKQRSRKRGSIYARRARKAVMMSNLVKRMYKYVRRVEAKKQKRESSPTASRWTSRRSGKKLRRSLTRQQPSRRKTCVPYSLQAIYQRKRRLQKKMITIKVCTVTRSKQFLICVARGETVGALKEKIQLRHSACLDQQILVHAGKVLSNNRTLHECNVGPNNVLYLAMPLRASGDEEDPKTAKAKASKQRKALGDITNTTGKAQASKQRKALGGVTHTLSASKYKLKKWTLKPPEHKEYKYDEIKLLGRKFEMTDIIETIVKADAGPSESTIRRLLEKADRSTPLNSDEVEKLQAMVKKGPSITEAINDNAPQPILMNTWTLKPPSGNKYTKSDIVLLGKKFLANEIIEAFTKAKAKPVGKTIQKYLKEAEEETDRSKPLSLEDIRAIDGLIESGPSVCEAPTAGILPKKVSFEKLVMKSPPNEENKYSKDDIVLMVRRFGTEAIVKALYEAGAKPDGRNIRRYIEDVSSEPLKAHEHMKLDALVRVDRWTLKLHKHTKDHVLLLGKKFETSAIVNAFNKAGVLNPAGRTIRGWLQNVQVGESILQHEIVELDEMMDSGPLFGTAPTIEKWTLKPPKQSRYQKEEIRLLGRRFDADVIVNAFNKVNAKPKIETIKKHLQGVDMDTPLNDDEIEKLQAMIACGPSIQSQDEDSLCFNLHVDTSLSSSVESLSSSNAEKGNTDNSTLPPPVVNIVAPTTSPVSQSRLLNKEAEGAEHGDTIDNMVKVLQEQAKNRREHEPALKKLTSAIEMLESSVQEDPDNMTKIKEMQTEIYNIEKKYHVMDPRLRKIAGLVLECNKNLSDDLVSALVPMTTRTNKVKYLKLAKQAICKPTSSDESQRDFVTRKSNKVIEYIDLLIDQETEHGKEIASRVVQKVGDYHGFAVVKKEDMELSTEDVVVLRDLIGCGTNGMYRLKSGLEALNEFLKGIFPSCIKARLARFEGNGNLQVETVNHQLLVSKADTRQKSLPFTFLLHPWRLVQRMVEKSKSEQSYELSQEWSSMEEKCVFTANIDKGGDDINMTIRCANKESGNSMKDTFSVASIGGPVCECLQNEEETMFSDKYPIRDFLYRMANDQYHILTITTPDRQCGSVIFLPLPVRLPVTGRCFNRSMKVELLDGFVEETAITFDNPTSLSGGAPEINIPIGRGKISVKLVQNEKRSAVGVQFFDRNVPIHAQRFCTPIFLGDGPPSEIKAALEQVVCFPVNDMKQQLIVCGIASNSCLCACPTCTCERGDFGKMSERLWKLLVERGLREGGCPYKDAPKREGDKDSIKLLEEYKKQTHDGNLKLSDGVMRSVNVKCASISKDIAWDFPHEKNSGEPLHLSSGAANHAFDEMRDEIRTVESNSEFMQGMHNAHKDMEIQLDVLASTSNQRKDKTVETRFAPLHKENLKLRNKMTKFSKKINHLMALKNFDRSTPNSQMFSLLDLQKDEEEIERAIEVLEGQADACLEDCKEHADSTNYAHYIQLHKGTMLFSEALMKFLSDSSKRPHGKLEFIFNNALEYIGGGQFMAEHSGFEQTNGRALNTLERFDKVAEVCVASFGSSETDPMSSSETDPMYESVKNLFEGYKKVAATLFKLATYMKSQQKLDSKTMDNYVLDFILAFEEVFPKVPYFNKLHFIMMHVPEFVERYQCLGRLSAESHESVHARLAGAKKVVMKMTSTKQKYETLYARSSVDLKEGIAPRKTLVEKKMTGKKRGCYNTTNNKSKQRDDIQFVSYDFVGTEVVDGEEFLILPCNGGRIQSKYRDRSLYVTQGRAPSHWISSFEGHLSLAKLEQANFATH